MLEEWYYSYLLLQRHHILDVITFVYMWSVVAALIGWLALKQLRNTKLSLYSGGERVSPEVLQAGSSRTDRAASPNLTRSELILIALSSVVVLLGLSWALGFDPSKLSRIVDTAEHTVRNRCFNGQGTYAQDDVNVACKQLVEDSTLALRNRRDDADAYFDRGFAYEHAGDLNRAVADFSQVVRLTPNRSQAYYFRWAAYKDLGFKEQADADFTTLKALNPTFAAEIRNNR